MFAIFGSLCFNCLQNFQACMATNYISRPFTVVQKWPLYKPAMLKGPLNYICLFFPKDRFGKLKEELGWCGVSRIIQNG